MLDTELAEIIGNLRVLGADIADIASRDTFVLLACGTRPKPDGVSLAAGQAAEG